MKLRMILVMAATVGVLASVPVRAARAQEYRGWGAYDKHHHWHDYGWWHRYRPIWFWQYHPEWAVHHPEWRRVDGDWDDHHHWHDRDWWYRHDPRWVESHHPHWERWHD